MPAKPGGTLLSWRFSIPESSAVTIDQSLRQELAALQHELRRVNDGLERARSHELERRARQLRENIALCERELKQHAAALHFDGDKT
jgi:predicted phage gp36 major capsid-like protein